jgi:peroxiredoxin
VEAVIFRRFSCLLLLWGAVALAGVPQLRLRDTRGAVHTNSDWTSAKAILLFFVTTDCPVANSYVPEMNRIRDTYASRGVVVWAVQADATTPEPTVAKYAADYRYSFPLLLDPRQELVNLAGATITPQAAVLAPDGHVLYLGRIDNRVEDFGKQRPQATQADLRIALDEVLAGKIVSQPHTKSIGCAINRVK